MFLYILMKLNLQLHIPRKEYLSTFQGLVRKQEHESYVHIVHNFVVHFF